MKNIKINNFSQSAAVFFVFALLIFSVSCGSGKVEKFVNTNSNDVAIEGFDPVAYFTIENAVKGSPEFSAVWKGAKWFFSSEENKEMFEKNPEKYAPQYDGYCSFNMANGQLKEGNPEQFNVENGKLYLQNNGQAHDLWEKNKEELIKKAEENWEKMKDK